MVFFTVINVAVGKAPMQSSLAGNGIPQKAIDGSTSTFSNPDTCSMTQTERSPWWYVNLLEPYMVQLVRLDFGMACCSNNRPATIVVRVGNNRPDLGVNPICNKYTGFIEEGRPLFFALYHCHARGFCHFLPIERCPSFRDQPLGSTATYNGKCYIFFNNQPRNLLSARRFCEIRGGNLIDETSPALQGFLSWELFRRHRNDPNRQYWLGAVRDPRDPNNWKWINEPSTCGKPERPVNSTIVARNFDIGSVIEYKCNPGHLLVGPNIRTCLPSDFSANFLQNADIWNAVIPLIYLMVLITFLTAPVTISLLCSILGDEGHVLHPPPLFLMVTLRCLPTILYLEQLQKYYCDEGFDMRGKDTIKCVASGYWDGEPPVCIDITYPKLPADRQASTSSIITTSPTPQPTRVPPSTIYTTSTSTWRYPILLRKDSHLGHHHRLRSFLQKI
ncbi:sushi, von Willebrand factor type A, EGF and pentraxin domain-containing protein 1 [Caerostris extrusa]|uniref:Sushi, von Willebrand factor type A, EGF and pentraxin domain-containing protein 1 n=1 Tax=Caerostris extrusa TaxID=172846 RepID=A0AAV4PJP2_CAEEX|nr:sushi, von Willebrand factor type A, EGF and pentraxin domain-containing protein 1 [Caerostris extrusa]